MINVFTLFLFFIFSFQPSQEDIEEIKSKLTGTTRTKWVFEKLQKTMGDRKKLTSQDCVYSTIIFASKNSSYFGNRCGASTETGKWLLKKKGDEEFTITLDKSSVLVYDIDFYTKDLKGSQRRFLRLKIPGKNMNDPSLEYHYYAE